MQPSEVCVVARGLRMWGQCGVLLCAWHVYAMLVCTWQHVLGSSWQQLGDGGVWTLGAACMYAWAALCW